MGAMSAVVAPDRAAAVQRLPRLGYIPALDGLRALAVVAVLLYHGDVGWIPGGFLGVDVFFVISGYLITCLLLSDWRQQGRIGFARFYLRRARRLLPALFLMLGVVCLYAVLFLPDTVSELRGQVIAYGTPTEVYVPQVLQAMYGGRLAILQDGHNVDVYVDEHGCPDCT